MSYRRAIACLLGVSLAFTACSDPTSPNAPHVRSTSRVSSAVDPFARQILSPQWQERARAQVRTNGLNPFAAGRVYAALSVAQYRAVVASDDQVTAEGPQPDRGFDAGGRARYETHRGAVSGASAVVLGFLFPSHAASFEQQVAADAGANPGGVHPAFKNGLAIGRAAGAAMVERLKNDGSTLPWTGTIPVGPGYWTSNGTPAGANLGGWTPYLVNSTAQFRSAPPPALGSAAFNADLNEVLAIAQARTPQQSALAQTWAAAGAGSTPLGYWNELAAAYVTEAGLGERAATHVFAVMHAAQYDAAITCFESKYHYFTIRPSQAQPLITLAIGLPNYPAYPSGHASISSSAARVLQHFFPARAPEIANLVAEAGESRIYAGIHYRFDITEAWVLGNAVADWALAHQQDLL